MDVRLMDFYPPYGITVVRPLNEDDKAYCQVRLYTFRSSTSLAPTITPDPVTHKQWFDFFHNQFEAMWDIGKCAFTSPAS